MATEIAAGGYDFIERKRGVRGLSKLLAEKNEQVSGKPRLASGPGICYNYIHDIESVWWITAWVLFSFEKKAPSEDDKLDQQSSSTRWRNKERLFPGDLIYQDRLRFLSFEDDFQAYVLECIPQYFNDLVLGLGASREEIVSAYEREEVNKPIVITFKPNDDVEGVYLHTELLSILRQTEINMEDFDTVLIPSPGRADASKRAIDVQNECLPKRQKYVS